MLVPERAGPRRCAGAAGRRCCRPACCARRPAWPLGGRGRARRARLPEARRRASCRWRGRCRQIAHHRAAASAQGQPRGRCRPPTGRPCWRRRWPAQDLGLISEAGLPAVADPGAALVAAAHAAGVPVRAAGRAELAAAGAGGQRPERPELCLRRLPAAGAGGAHARCASWRRCRADCGQTQLVIETPYRNAALLAALLETLAPATRGCR